MGSGYKGDFGHTKGSIMMGNSQNKKTIDSIPIVNATGKVKTIIDNSPINIPKTATYAFENKDNYEQIKINFKKGKYEYESRWHTPTPKAPKNIGNTYQVTRRIKGKGYGKNASKKILDHMIKYPSGKVKWISHKLYQDALRNVKARKATKKEKEIVKNGHIK